MRLVLLIGSSLCAMLIPFQAIINGRLGQVLGNPLLAALVSFICGAIALTLVIVVSTPGVPSLPANVHLSEIPPYLYVGGLLGAIYVTVVLSLAPRLGAANVIAAGIVGQLAMSVIIDHYGILGVPRSAISVSKLAGCLMLLLGMALIQRR